MSPCLDKAGDHAVGDQVVKHRLQKICNPPLQSPLIHPPHLHHSRPSEAPVQDRILIMDGFRARL